MSGPVSPSTRAYMARKLASVDQNRAHPPSEADLARLLAEMQSPDEQTRARAVRQVCPCHLSWDVFQRVRKAALRLQRDPSPLVREQARHVAEDAREIEALEALREWLEEHEDAGWGEAAPRQARRIQRQRAHRRCPAQPVEQAAGEIP